jgi:hypothetical protein
MDRKSTVWILHGYGCLGVVIAKLTFPRREVQQDSVIIVGVDRVESRAQGRSNDTAMAATTVGG